MLIRPVDFQQAGDFVHRFRMIFNPKIQCTVFPRFSRFFSPDHQYGRRLLAPDIPTFALGGLQGGHHPFGQRALARVKGLGHGRPDGVVQHHVGLYRKIRPGTVSGLCYAFFPGIGGYPSLGVDDGHLPKVPAFIRFDKFLYRLLRAQTRSKQFEASRTEGGIYERLRGNGTDAGLGPGNHLTDREPVRLYRHTDIAGDRIAGYDRKCVGEGIAMETLLGISKVCRGSSNYQ